MQAVAVATLRTCLQYCKIEVEIKFYGISEEGDISSCQGNESSKTDCGDGCRTL